MGMNVHKVEVAVFLDVGFQELVGRRDPFMELFRVDLEFVVIREDPRCETRL